MEEEPIPYQHRFVADARTATVLARAMVRHVFGQWRVRLAFVLFWWAFAGIIYLGYDDSLSVGARVFGALLFGVVPTIVLHTLLRTLTYVRTVRGARLRLFAGAVLQSGFGDDAMVFSNPVASSRTSYVAVRSIVIDGAHVFIRYEGNPLIAGYPRELFPDGAVERIRARSTT